jgi:FlaA1/EpsC-like NDP-sugar epimerase
MNILITGGTGSLGSALSRKWYGQGHNITILSRDPHKQARLAVELPQARFVLCDICDRDAVRDACKGQDVLVHAAAQKLIHSGEMHPIETTRVNIAGSQNVSRAWAETHHEPHPVTLCHPVLPRKALYISSDKAVSALNLYGATKRVPETIFQNYGFSSIRYGNVIGSQSSFIPIWFDRIEKGQPIAVRTPEPTRFALMMDEAIALVENALEMIPTGNGLFVPHSLKAFSIWDVARALGAERQTEPLLPGEKQHEILLAEGEQEGERGRLVSRVEPGFDGDRAAFCSATAPRMTGEELLRMVEWKS